MAVEDSDKSLGQVVNEVSEKAAQLVREEIELAKAEISAKVTSLAVGAAVVAVAGFFVFFGLVAGLHTVAYLLSELFNSFWLGYLVTALGLFVLAAVAALIAVAAFKRGSPPVPEMAIDEAKRTKEKLEETIG